MSLFLSPPHTLFARAIHNKLRFAQMHGICLFICFGTVCQTYDTLLNICTERAFNTRVQVNLFHKAYQPV